jgi:hypothetical protein
MSNGNGNGNGSSGDPTPASSAIALLPGMSVVSLPSPGCFDFSPYPGVWAPGCWSAPDTGRRKEVDRGPIKAEGREPGRRARA